MHFQSYQLKKMLDVQEEPLEQPLQQFQEEPLLTLTCGQEVLFFIFVKVITDPLFYDSQQL